MLVPVLRVGRMVMGVNERLVNMLVLVRAVHPWIVPVQMMFVVVTMNVRMALGSMPMNVGVHLGCS